MKRCNDCIHSFVDERGHYRCTNPTVNRARPAFLAGKQTAAMNCFDERQNVVGVCGRQGRLYEQATHEEQQLADKSLYVWPIEKALGK